MNSFERTLIEKAGADNGWECILESTPERIILASSQNPVTVQITTDSIAAIKYTLEFSEDVDRTELSRLMPDFLFDTTGIHAINEETLALVLRRYAELVVSLPARPLDQYEAEVSNAIDEQPGIRGTETERLVRQRIGQDVYRKALLKYWEGQCAVTGITVSEILRASHAKPWADCETDGERLNVYNGFLLSANLDGLFDSGLISFSDEGDMVISADLDEAQRKEIGLDTGLSLRWIDRNHIPFLKWHRDRVFKGS